MGHRKLSGPGILWTHIYFVIRMFNTGCLLVCARGRSEQMDGVVVRRTRGGGRSRVGAVDGELHLVAMGLDQELRTWSVSFAS